MECKAAAEKKALVAISINRNIVECKDSEKNFIRHSRRVLIETLWNVKLQDKAEPCGQDGRINRNIVECKGDISVKKMYSNDVLIETLWNVKS